MRLCTDVEYGSLHYMILTSNVDRDPRVLDFNIDDDKDWYRYDAMLDNVNHSELLMPLVIIKDVQNLESCLPILGWTLLLWISTPGFNWRKPLLSVPNMHILHIILTMMI
jgi:hypothetical protein